MGVYLLVPQSGSGYGHSSLPFSPPLFSGRIFASEPVRGDVVVFRLPKDDSIDYIKRVIGLPGDRLPMIGGVLHINGGSVKPQPLCHLTDDAKGRAARPLRTPP